MLGQPSSGFGHITAPRSPRHTDAPRSGRTRRSAQREIPGDGLAFGARNRENQGGHDSGTAAAGVAVHLQPLDLPRPWRTRSARVPGARRPEHHDTTPARPAGEAVGNKRNVPVRDRRGVREGMEVATDGRPLPKIDHETNVGRKDLSATQVRQASKGVRSVDRSVRRETAREKR